ncbi:hypothetical protein BU24DRAFT_476979 [Aaosphaeria arxii CBS 175.79]|uniref:Uncharacterized protein n=1 Tax=Aaosphaeria arxii CBS 175.79 TaxID=1450172 RepID=A0A6A5Y3Y4_9PLEO|nr:uncharacterized protein BU24DRAFT_476979 [Aaosphaeria arxii CBS 175.79]KAF2019903.1 hypothetical protein BU24DRAFT_476979 [Aaosphaeria arxii CBS 175.79]
MADTSNPPQPIISPPTSSTTLPSQTTPTTTTTPDPISPPSTTSTSTTTLPPPPSSFPHKSSAGLISPSLPFISTSTPAINENDPVELDTTTTTTTASNDSKTGTNVSPSLREEDDIAAEFLAEGGEAGDAGRVVREKRAEMIAERARDPSVIVDVPREPTAEEVEAARSGEGVVTPGLGGREFGGR